MPIRKAKLIEDNKYYSIKQLYNLKVFPWNISYGALKRLVRNHKSKFKPIMFGTGTGRRYLIKGKNILDIQEKLKKGYDFEEK